MKLFFKKETFTKETTSAAFPIYHINKDLTSAHPADRSQNLTFLFAQLQFWLLANEWHKIMYGIAPI